MPNRDGTGPQGRGPLTGRGLGDCCPQGFRRGFRRRFRGGWGRGQWIDTEHVELTKEEKRKILEEEKKAIEKELKELK